jgi:hypothetical protein
MLSKEVNHSDPQSPLTTWIKQICLVVLAFQRVQYMMDVPASDYFGLSKISLLFLYSSRHILKQKEASKELSLYLYLCAIIVILLPLTTQIKTI